MGLRNLLCYDSEKSESLPSYFSKDSLWPFHARLANVPVDIFKVQIHVCPCEQLLNFQLKVYASITAHPPGPRGVARSIIGGRLNPNLHHQQWCPTRQYI